MTTYYDELRAEVKETQENCLQAIQYANAPDARSVVRELDEIDAMDNAVIPWGAFVADELVVQIVPQAQDEFTCHCCFLVRHISQIAAEKYGHSYCAECEC